MTIFSIFVKDISYLLIQKTGTGHICDKQQTNQRIAMIFEIHTIKHVVLKSYHHILKDVEMRAI